MPPFRRSHGVSMKTARLEGRDYWLLPKDEALDGFRQQEYDNELLKYNDASIKGIPEFTYTNLPGDKKRIRLLKLYSGESCGSRIYCELMEVEYDNEFHIPSHIMDEQGSKIVKDMNTLAVSAENDEVLEGERSDLETRLEKGKQKETTAERSERKKRENARRKELAALQGKSKEVKDAEEADVYNKRLKKLKNIRANEVQYEALSWHWGTEEEDYVVLINVGGKEYKKKVRRELALALKYLRRPGNERTLWIDAICINQTNPNERNHQVQMMSRVYTRAKQVCIWLGEADEHSEIAINFIKDDIMELKNFDTITSDEQYMRKWQALMMLMQRDWFFRRWVIQEIALAKAAMMYCGSYSVPWKDFAVAVELFVEVETATHRLSEVMKKDVKFRHVPGWFEYVSHLGASLLVQATGKVFRTKESPMQPGPGGSDDGKNAAKRPTDKVVHAEKLDTALEKDKKQLNEIQTIDPLERRSLLSLEYLVSTMFTFQASEPRDVVYALLAIARDASPFAPAHYGQEDQKLVLVMTLLDRFLAEKPFVVDYNRPYSDVSRDFVQFSIDRMHKIDAHQALDILCRPWALEPPHEKISKRASESIEVNKEGQKPKPQPLMKKRTKWSKKVCKKWETESVSEGGPVWEDDPRSFEDYWKEAPQVGDKAFYTLSQENPKQEANIKSVVTTTRWDKLQKSLTRSKEQPDIDLPSWVARASQAPFILDHAPGIDIRKTSRANADALVGAPLDGHRNYNASGSEKLNLSNVKYRKRPMLGHYSMYLKGFILDEVKEVEDASQLGGIPSSWLTLGGWTDFNQDPPDDFWRTIVADRGRENKNPPYYYARACKESVLKGSYRGGSVNTAALINDERNSIIAEFCRRVHAVIWNRCLFKTEAGRLGLAYRVKPGDLVCIFYGCTVPVILRERKKATSETFATEFNHEVQEDRIEILKKLIRQAVRNRERRAKYKPKQKEYEKEGEWEGMMDARQSYLEGKRAEDAETRTNEARKLLILRTAEFEKVKAKCDESQEEIQNARNDESAEHFSGEGSEKASDNLEKAQELATKAKEEAMTTFEHAAKVESQIAEGIYDNQATEDEPERYDPKDEKWKDHKEPTEDDKVWYTFKGECYLHGMMDGEAMREHFYGGLPDKTFELR